jgi:hypothetical protein
MPNLLLDTWPFVVLGEEMEIAEIFTLDVKGFSTYRMHSKKPFRLWPA